MLTPVREHFHNPGFSLDSSLASGSIVSFGMSDRLALVDSHICKNLDLDFKRIVGWPTVSGHLIDYQSIGHGELRRVLPAG
jgi:hypothetical protein